MICMALMIRERQGDFQGTTESAASAFATRSTGERPEQERFLSTYGN